MWPPVRIRAGNNANPGRELAHELSEITCRCLKADAHQIHRAARRTVACDVSHALTPSPSFR